MSQKKTDRIFGIRAGYGEPPAAVDSVTRQRNVFRHQERRPTRLDSYRQDLKNYWRSFPKWGSISAANYAKKAVAVHSTTDEVILEWIQQASDETADKRHNNRRYPFFRRVTMTIDHSQQTKLSAFSRDISSSGIGLLHNVPVEPGPLSLTISTTRDRQIDVSTKIAWCQSCGVGWYFSGGRFTGLSVVNSASLLLPAMAEVDRRLKQRYPFFRPVTITIADSQGTKLPGFSRDISTSGIGLLHKTPLETQHAILTIPRKAHQPFDVRSEIMWCKPCGNGWYVNGGPFVRPMFEQLPDRLL